MRHRSLVASTLLAAIAVAGCGSSGNTLSRSELIAKANPICKRANNAFDSSKISLNNVATVGPSVAAVEQQVSAELAKLDPPSSMASGWKTMVEGFHRASVGLQNLGQAAKTSPSSKPSQALIEDDKEVLNAQNSRASAASSLGVGECGKF